MPQSVYLHNIYGVYNSVITINGLDYISVLSPLCNIRACNIYITNIIALQ